MGSSVVKTRRFGREHRRLWVPSPEKGLFPHLPMELFTSVQAMAGSTTMSLTVSSHRRPSDLVLPVSYPPVGPSRRHELPWAAAVRRKASHGISFAHVMR